MDGEHAARSIRVEDRLHCVTSLKGKTAHEQLFASLEQTSGEPAHKRPAALLFHATVLPALQRAFDLHQLACLGQSPHHRFASCVVSNCPESRGTSDPARPPDTIKAIATAASIMCSVDIVFAYCPSHNDRREVRREAEKLCGEARKKLRMGACSYGIIERRRYDTDSFCRAYLARLQDAKEQQKRAERQRQRQSQGEE